MKHSNPLADPTLQTLLRDIARFCLFRPDVLRLIDRVGAAR
jgi:hypothetical protein